MGTPKPPQIQPDPMLQQLQQTADKQQIAAMQSEAAGDTASILARYGARMAMGATPATPARPTGIGLGSFMGGYGTPLIMGILGRSNVGGFGTKA